MTWFTTLSKNKLKGSFRFPAGGRSWGRRLLFTTAILVLLLFLLFSTAVSQPSPGGYWYDVRSLEGAELGVDRPASLTYSSTAGAFFLLGEGEASGATADMVRFTLYGDRIGDSRLATAIPDPLNAAFHAPAGELLFLDPARQKLTRLEVGAGGDRPVSEQALRQFNIQAYGLVNPQGIALDGDGSRLFVLDAAGPAIVTIQADEAGQFAGGAVTRVSLTALEALSLRGLAFHPDTGRFFVSSPAERKVYELTAEGQILSVFDLASLNLGDPQGLLLAPSGDPTDDPAQLNLYIVDWGLPGRSGQVVELSLTPPVLGPMPEATILASLVQVIDTSIWSPPSPDPAGIDFHLGLGRLVHSDSEVEEMDIYEGKNIFISNTAGNLTGTCDTTEFTNEPTGTAVNPNNGHLFFTADGQDEVFEVSPGQDGQYCTGDDTLTTFDTQAFNSFDPEGVGYGAGRLMIADGEGTQVYVVDPGNNGLFDGVPPDGDDQVTNFDTLNMGLRDPEGIGFHWDNGTIFINSRIDEIIVETNFSGTVLNVYDVEAIPILNAGGLGVGPSSQGGPMSVYVAARGVDNGSDPDENDGKIYEISLAGPVPTPTSTSGPSPTSTSTPPPSTNPLYLSLVNSGPTTVGTLSGVRDEDIIAFDGSVWTMFFDGTDVGVSGDVNAFYIMDGDTLLLTFSAAVSIPPIGTVDEFDIVRFDATSLGDNTAGTFSLYFDGADVDLADASTEDIDALDVLPNGDLLISVTGSPVVPGVSDGRDEDILRFAPTSLGANTSGTWSMYFDGSDVGLSGGPDIDAVTVATNGNIYLSTADAFAVPGVSGDDEDVFVCSPTSLGDNTACTYSPALYFDGSTWGLAADDVDGINRPAIAPPATPTPTPVPPTNTPTPVPPTATNTPTPVPPTATNTPTAAPPTATATPPLPTGTSTPVPPTATNTPTAVPPTATATPPLPTNTPTTAPPSPTATTVPSVTPTPGRTRIPTATSTPAASATPGPSATPPPPSPGIYLSLANGGPTTVGNLSGVRDEDIIVLNGTVWSMVFDGSDVGVQSSVDAFYNLDADTILFSLARAEVVGSLGIVDSFDIIQFDATSLGDNTAGTFSLYFDGSDVGLNTSTENVDAFDVLSDGTLLFSFAGNALLPGISGVTDEDLLRFTPTSLGANTSGTWSMYFDGSDVGLGGNGDIDATTVGANGNIYLSTLAAFSLPGVSGENEDVFVCTPTSLGDTTACTYSPALYFDGSAWGLGSDNVDAIGLP